jgi:hypothetical protein
MALTDVLVRQCVLKQVGQKGKGGIEEVRKHALREMEEGPPQSVVRYRLQTTIGCCGQKPWC